MENLISIFVDSVFVGNILLAYFLGMCSFLAVSKNLQTSLGLGIAVVFVLTITTPVNWLIYRYLLAPGALAWAGLAVKADVEAAQVLLASDVQGVDVQEAARLLGEAIDFARQGQVAALRLGGTEVAGDEPGGSEVGAEDAGTAPKARPSASAPAASGRKPPTPTLDSSAR